MEIINLKILKGPNHWSETENNLIVLTISGDNVGALTTYAVKDLTDKLKSIIPSLFEKEKDLYEKMAKGISLRETIARVAAELQWLAGTPSEHINSNVDPDSNLCHVVYSYSVEQVGMYAGKFAVSMIETIMKGQIFSGLQNNIADLIKLKSRHSIGPTATYLLDEIKRRNIPHRRFNVGSLILIGHGLHQKKLRTALTDSTSGLGMEIASDKDETKRMLADAHIPVPKGILVRSEEELRARIHEVEYPVVIKPLDGNHGRGITTDIHDMDKAMFGLELAQKISKEIIIEEFIKGDDYRFLVVNYKLIAATKRTPAYIKGDGKQTIGELIEKENENPERGHGAEFVLAKIKIDAVTEKILSDKNLTLDSVLPKNEILTLKETANISAGGIATDVTDSVHPDNVFMAERIARMFNLDICGIDIMATAVDVPITRSIGAVIEVNAGPGLRMHSNPQEGKPRNVATEIIDMLHPDISSASIPIIAVSDFIGSWICALLLSHLIKQQGFKPGCNTSAGTFIQGHLTATGERTQYEDVQEVLFDPTIDVAILQCVDSEISNSGLAFNKCDFVIIADTQNLDHKKVLLRCLSEDGYAILNADVEEIVELSKDLKCKVAFFGMDAESEPIKEHISKNKPAASIKNGMITTFYGINEVPIGDMSDIAFGKEDVPAVKAHSILPAVLIASLRNNDTEIIKEGLRSFTLKK